MKPTKFKIQWKTHRYHKILFLSKCSLKAHDHPTISIILCFSPKQGKIVAPGHMMHKSIWDCRRIWAIYLTSFWKYRQHLLQKHFHSIMRDYVRENSLYLLVSSILTKTELNNLQGVWSMITYLGVKGRSPLKYVCLPFYLISLKWYMGIFRKSFSIQFWLQKGCK